MTYAETPSLDAILERFNPDESTDNRKDEKRNLTLQMPKRYKDKFMRLQAKTEKKCGQTLKEILMAALDRMPE